jgi:ABC-2 type transport system permease protein
VYLGVALLIMAVALSFVAVGLVSAARKEESSGRLDNLLVGTLSREAWFAQLVALGTMVLLLGGLLAGFATWLGAALDHSNVGLASMLEAGNNLAVPAFLLFGAGMLALAVVPRLVIFVLYGLLVWFFLVEIVGGVVKASHLMLDLSAFHQMAAAPATPVAWTANEVMIAIALASAILGVMIFSRRDLVGE